MSDLVGNPKDRFSRVAAQCILKENQKLMPFTITVLQLGQYIFFFRFKFLLQKSSLEKKKKKCFALFFI